MEETETLSQSHSQVTSWLTEYVYEIFWKNYVATGFIDMGLRFMIDGLIQMRGEDYILMKPEIDVMMDVIKFILYLLDCDPEDDSSDEERKMTEDKLWEICQTFHEEKLNNLVLVHNVVSNMMREDFQTARDWCIGLDNDVISIDESLKNEIRSCVASGNSSHRFVQKFKYNHFRDKCVQIVRDLFGPDRLFTNGQSVLSLAARRAIDRRGEGEDVFFMDCGCGTAHPAPASLRHVVENEPFVGMKVILREEGRLRKLATRKNERGSGDEDDGDDGGKVIDVNLDDNDDNNNHAQDISYESNASPFTTTTTTNTQPFQTPAKSKAATNVTIRRKSTSSILNSSLTYVTPRQNLLAQYAVTKTPPKRQGDDDVFADSPPVVHNQRMGEETQELMTQPLFPVAITGATATINVEGDKEMDDEEITGSGESSDTKRRSGSPSLFSSLEKQDLPSSGEEKARENEGSSKVVQSPDVDILDESRPQAQTQAVHTLPYFGAAIGKLIGKVTGNVKVIHSDEGRDRIREEDVGNSKYDEEKKGKSRDEVPKSTTEGTPASKAAKAAVKFAAMKDALKFSANRRNRLTSVRVALDRLEAGPSTRHRRDDDDGDGEKSPDIFLGQGRRSKPRKVKRGLNARGAAKPVASPGENCAIASSPSPEKSRREDEEKSKVTETDPISEAETEDYGRNKNETEEIDDDDNDDFVDCRLSTNVKYRTTSKNVAKIQPTLAPGMGTGDVLHERPVNVETKGKSPLKAAGKRKTIDDEDVEGETAGKKRKTSPSTGRRRGKIEWTNEESYHIWKGVQRYGEGNWGKILEIFGDKFHASRTNISVKDRWRTMVKNGIDKQITNEFRDKS